MQSPPSTNDSRDSETGHEVGSHLSVSNNRPTVCVIGDLRTDIIVELDGYSFDAAAARSTQFRPVQLVPGGTALGMCKALRPKFGEVSVISAIGSDVLRATLTDELAKHANWLALEPIDCPNGLTLIAFSGGTPGQQRTRWALASPDTPYFHMSQAWLETTLPAALRSDIVAMDCLLLTRKNSLPTATFIASAAGKAECFFAVDVVPHNILQYVEREHVFSLLGDADCVTVELETLMTLVDQPISNCRHTLRDAEYLYHSLAPFLPPTHWVVVRFGALNIEHSVLFSPNGQSLHTDSGAEIKRGGSPSGSAISAIEYGVAFDEWAALKQPPPPTKGKK